MGKGKGGKVGVQVRVYPGRILVAFSAIRLGSLTALYRKVRVRCRFTLGLQHALGCSLPSLFEGPQTL